jgi:hypothetical protein
MDHWEWLIHSQCPIDTTKANNGPLHDTAVVDAAEEADVTAGVVGVFVCKLAGLPLASSLAMDGAVVFSPCVGAVVGACEKAHVFASDNSHVGVSSA